MSQVSWCTDLSIVWHRKVDLLPLFILGSRCSSCPVCCSYFGFGRFEVLQAPFCVELQVYPARSSVGKCVEALSSSAKGKHSEM